MILQPDQRSQSIPLPDFSRLGARSGYVGLRTLRNANVNSRLTAEKQRFYDDSTPNKQGNTGEKSTKFPSQLREVS
jgi:hypothetical protein